MSIYYQDDYVKCGPSEVPKIPGIMRIFDILRSTRTAPESAGNTRRGLTRSSDITREGLPDMVPSNSPRDPYADIEGESAVERKNRLAREKTRRYRARLAGEDVPWQPRPRGYQQSEEHKRKRLDAITGERHPRWAGEAVSEKGGRKRALRMYPTIGPCTNCGAENTERHHIDANTANNHPSNIEVLCRRCHMATDGRLDRVTNVTPYRGC